ncbi:MAG: DNA primase [Alloprevotella sp.]|nr:DNA primase [Alloprevotella sp.]
MIDRSTIQRVIDATDIVDVVREFVDLRKAGVNYKGLCPFHNEKTPSFVVSPAKQLCKCFSCGKGGSAVHFLMEIEQMTYPEAIKWLGRKYGIEVREKELTDEEKQASSVRESMFVLNEWARDFFETTLHDTPDGEAVGMAYLRSRGLRDDIIRKFQLGFSNNQRDALAQAAIAKGYSRDYLLRTGLCYEGDGQRLIDRYRGRVIFPVHSISGKIVAFGGRILTDDKKLAKYVNSPESEIYSKSRELYGLYLAKKAIVKENRCYMVEGYMDVISMHQSGIENVVASSGTSLTEGQIRLLHRFTSNITVLYDGDAAGIHASIRGIDMLLAEGMNVKVMLIPDGDDPDSFARKHTPEEFRQLIEEGQTDFITFKTELLLKDAGNDPLKRAELVRDIANSIAAIPEGITRQAFAHECASRMDMDEQVILDTISKVRREESRRKYQAEKNREAETGGEEQKPETKQPETKPAEDDLTAYMTRNSNAEEQPERLLIQQVVRHGGIRLPLTEGEDNNEDEPPTLSVAQYIAQDLAADGITLSNELYARILKEAAEHSEDPDFDAPHYFLSHTDEAVSRLAVELGQAPYQLSRNQQQQYGNEADHLEEIVPRLLNDFKFALIQTEKRSLERQIRQLSADGDLAKCMTAMQQYKEISELFARLCAATGDKVVSNMK